ncbi:cell division protein SepF [[Mycobacterium] kokjensenii]|uniref:Cell division protein SepF n=1 Tax=[Mycobacterium] kokjensenii TaxID=3064287 RepID=A0ABN9MY24_9MYCO|nr:cell division protein SepF [Mycolicibacter sp. MU0083]CAJ1497090.1 cell division protein SepF [Mycolicibacter sp. MU0083]
MSTLHKVKAYFGMAPMEDYDDDYYDDGDDRAGSRDYAPRAERFNEDVFDRVGRSESRYDDRFEDRDYDDEPAGYRGGYDAPRDSRYRTREFDRPRDLDRGRFGSPHGATLGALAMEPRRMAQMFDEGSPLSKIVTLRPKDYSEARTIGERFRDGAPVIMDLVSMDNADAKRLVDFAAGLAFALRGSFDKVATKVFLLSPADVVVSPEERRRIAETGFYAYR